MAWFYDLSFMISASASGPPPSCEIVSKAYKGWAKLLGEPIWGNSIDYCILAWDIRSFEGIERWCGEQACYWFSSENCPLYLAGSSAMLIEYCSRPEEGELSVWS